MKPFAFHQNLLKEIGNHIVLNETEGKFTVNVHEKNASLHDLNKNKKYRYYDTIELAKKSPLFDLRKSYPVILINYKGTDAKNWTYRNV